MNLRKPVINFFVFSSSIFHCGPWRNSIQLWAEKGFTVNVFQMEDTNLHKHITALENNYTLHEIKFPKIIYFLNRWILCNKHLRYYGGGSIIYLVGSLYFAAACLRKTNRNVSNILIGGDPQGLLAANLNAIPGKDILIYWSLELWIRKDIKKLGHRIFKWIEMKCNRKTSYTIDFGEKRCELLRNENSLPIESMLSIPNSPLGNAKVERNYLFNDKLDIPKNKKIVLYAGGISNDHMILDIIKSINLWPSNTVLVLHFKNMYSERRLKQIKEQIRDHPSKIYLSLDPVDYFDLFKIYSSADIGLQFFRPRIANLKFADLSSGKLFHYMKAGVPIITNRLPGYKKLIEGNGCGLCVSDITDIGNSIKTILDNEYSFKENCIRSFSKYRFRDHHEKFEKSIKAIYASKAS